MQGEWHAGAAAIAAPALSQRYESALNKGVCMLLTQEYALLLPAAGRILRLKDITDCPCRVLFGTKRTAVFHAEFLLFECNEILRTGAVWCCRLAVIAALEA